MQRRGSGEPEAKEPDDETSDASPGQMKGSKPNPLRTPTARDWVGRNDEKSGFPPPKKADEDERERRRKKYLAGKVQNRG